MYVPPRLTSYRRGSLVFDVRDEGPIDGAPVVLLHGFSQTSSSWALVTPLLHEAAYRTYAPDQRGYSPGARPSRRRDYRISELVDDVVALIDVIGQPVHLVGHDWGGGVGWMLASQRSELVRTWTTVSTPHPGALFSSFVRSSQLRESWYMAMFQLPFLPERALSSPRGFEMLGAGGMSREAVSRYCREVVESGALRTALHWYRALPFADPRWARTPVTVPTTLVWSDGDVALGRCGAELTSRFVSGDYSFVELPDVSHWIPEEAPAELAAAALQRFAS